jgi:signal transduction histidine kinase
VRRQVSLKWQLVRRLLALQAALLTMLAVLVVGTLWATGWLLAERDEDHVIDVLGNALARDASGGLALRATPDLKRLRSETPDLWFVIRDPQGHSRTEGAVPPEFARIGDALDHINQARLGWQIGDDPRRPAARLKRVETAAGGVQILTATQGRLSPGKAALSLSLLLAGVVLPALLPMALATLMATPAVVRHSLAGLGEAAAQAARIDINRRGARLPTEGVAIEILPLVTAVNGALGRLDDGHERHLRFLADAAHELRTPIAILSTRLESLPRSAETARLVADAARLATLTDQLLDLQRLNQNVERFTCVDLVAAGRQVAADLAPFAIAAGYDLSFEPDSDPILMMGDRPSLERALTNLVQNAIEHGGGSGTITLRMNGAGEIAVADQGQGIPFEHRDRIFEPFYRLHPRDRGAGLGLNLVREIVHLHGGSISVLDQKSAGACFRINMPVLSG